MFLPVAAAAAAVVVVVVVNVSQIRLRSEPIETNSLDVQSVPPLYVVTETFFSANGPLI